MTPVVVEIPHAGLSADPLALATLAAPARSLAQDADLYVDELYADAPDEGAAVLVSHVSRYVCDLNRASDDADSLAVEGGRSRSAPHGMIWRSTTEKSRRAHRSALAQRIRATARPDLSPVSRRARASPRRAHRALRSRRASLRSLHAELRA